MVWFIGIVLPPLIDYLNKSVLTDEEKTLVTVFLCFLVAVIFDWNLIQQATWNDALAVLKLAGVFVAEAMTVYKLYWKNSVIRQVLPGNGVG